MGSSTVKDLLEVVQLREIPRWRDPIGPVKLEAIDFILYNYLEMFAKRLEAVEDHLERGQGTPFIRFKERPDVGGAALQDLSENIRKLNERLDRVERRGE